MISIWVAKIKRKMSLNLPFLGGSAGFSSSFIRDRDELRVMSSWLLCEDARLVARAC